MVREFRSASGKRITVGENAGENQAVCKGARQNDEWFHVDGCSSAHAVVSLEGEAATRDDIHDCAQLVKHFSKQRFVSFFLSLSLSLFALFFPKRLSCDGSSLTGGERAWAACGSTGMRRERT